MKTLSVTGSDELKDKVPDAVVSGNPNAWVTISKAHSESQGWMKSTKAMLVYGGGCLVQVSTQQRNPDGSWSLAEALTFVPGAAISSYGIVSSENETFPAPRNTPSSAPLLYDTTTIFEDGLPGVNDIDMAKDLAQTEMI